MFHLDGTDGLYRRHLVFDPVQDPASAGPREHFEAAARSVRDILSQRWVATEESYLHQNPKRIYYLSMEFLIGRSLANNVTNLLIGDLVKRVIADDKVDWLRLLEQEPDAGFGCWRLKLGVLAPYFPTAHIGHHRRAKRVYPGYHFVADVRS